MLELRVFERLIEQARTSIRDPRVTSLLMLGVIAWKVLVSRIPFLFDVFLRFGVSVNGLGWICVLQGAPKYHTDRFCSGGCQPNFPQHRQTSTFISCWISYLNNITRVPKKSIIASKSHHGACLFHYGSFGSPIVTEV